MFGEVQEDINPFNKMQRSFTILEVVVVLLVIGILVAIGMLYFNPVIERSRGSEAKVVLKQIREEAVALYLQDRGQEVFTDSLAGIGMGSEPIPGPTEDDCTNKHYFWYKIEPDSTVSNFTATATRCISGGRQPNGILPRYLKLMTNLTAKTDQWMSDVGY